MSVRKREWESGGEKKTAWVVDYKDCDGKRRLRTFPRKADADRWEKRAGVQVQEGTHVADSASITVKEAADIWIEAVRTRGRKRKGPAEASTLRQYQGHVDNHIVPLIGSEKLSRLTAPRVETLCDDLLSKLNPPTAKKVLTSFKSILNEARTRGHISRNPAADVQIGVDDRDGDEIKVPDVADIRAILAKLDELTDSKQWRRWRALLQVAIHTGMRASEIRGLPWGAVDVDAGTIAIYQRADEKGVIGSPKSKTSRRTINIPAPLVQTLREWKLESARKDDKALVFGTGTGKPENLSNIYVRAWKPIQCMAGVADPARDESGDVVRDDEGNPVMQSRYNFHSLRHFHASMLIDDGTNPKEVQAEMGHASIQVTYDLYGHLFQDEEADKRRRERSDRLAGLLA